QGTRPARRSAGLLPAGPLSATRLCRCAHKSGADLAAGRQFRAGVDRVRMALASVSSLSASVSSATLGWFAAQWPNHPVARRTGLRGYAAIHSLRAACEGAGREGGGRLSGLLGPPVAPLPWH